MAQQDERVYTVEGMSCGHCQAAVTETVGALEGVSAVAVDLGSGTATVRGEGLDDEAVVGAIEEAGYSGRRA